MTAVSNSITRIRRLIGDVNSQVFTDARILRAFGRAQQEWCRDTQSLVKAVAIACPPHISASCTYQWEEAYADTDKSFVPFYNDGTYAATQPWELDTGMQATGGYTMTDGGACAYETPQHMLPFFLPDDFYAMKGLWYDYKWVDQKPKGWVEEIEIDAFKSTGDVVDWWSMLEEARKKAFVTHSIPTTKSLTNEGYDDLITMLDTGLLDDIFVALYSAVPELPDDTTDTIEVQRPFEKYVEYDAAAKLLRSDTLVRDRVKAEHYLGRYRLAVGQMRAFQHKMFRDRVRGLGGWSNEGDLRPPPPRFPDHYPKVEFRGR